MKMTPINYSIYALISVVIVSCQAHSDKKPILKESHAFSQQVTIHKSDSVKLELDSITSCYIPCFQYKEENNIEKLFYLNEETGCVYVNDLKTNKIISQITPDLAPEKRKKKIQGFYYHNKDSIFLIAFAPKIFLINDSGKIKNTFETSNVRAKGQEKLIYQALYATTRNIPSFFNHNLYINSIVVGNLRPSEQRKTQVIVDISNKKVSLGKPFYPDEYFKNYGGMDYNVYSTTYNPFLKEIVYSYPAMDSIVILSILNNNIKKVYAGSKYIDIIPEYEKENFKDAVSGIDGEYFMRTPSFGPILYDQFKNLYYRLAFLPVSEENANYDIKNAPTKQVSIAVYDSVFNYLGEKLLEKNIYWPNSVFVSKAGLNIQRKTEGDETCDFDVFTVAR